MVQKVNLAEKLAQFSEHWSPRIVGELNGQQVKLVKLEGEFVWHHHENEDELFLVAGRFQMTSRRGGRARSRRTGPWRRAQARRLGRGP